MVKSQSSDTSNLSIFCSFESLKRRNEKRQKVEENHKSIIHKFLAKSNVPSWYRALSSIQLNAADSLFDNIRDDMEQGTTYRCRRAIIRLGLAPLENSSNIKLVLNISKGNDLAFLWFLMDLFYKDTCIDCDHPKSQYNVNQEIIMTTMSHLDMITTLRELNKLLPEQPKIPKKEPPKKIKKTKEVYASPYLEPLPRPKFITTSKKMVRLPTKLNLESRYLAYKDPNYVVRNESNRWFALPDEARDELDFGLNDPQKNAKIISKILLDQVKAIFSESFNREKIFEALCSTHQKKKETDKHLRHILQVAVREQNRKHFSLEETKKFRLKKAGERLQKYAKDYQEKCDQEVEKLETQRWVKTFIEELIYNSTAEIQPKCSTYGPCPLNRNNNDCYKEIKQCNCYCTYEEDYFDYGHYGMPKPNQIYFRAPTQNKPYKFRYETIFKDDLNEKNDPIKRAIYDALDLSNYENEEQAIDEWMKKTWQEEVKCFNDEYNKQQAEKNEIELIQYNPYDDEVMTQLLVNAFQKMRENPKFVLASLPEAHKHPCLKEFVRQRYGYKITQKEKLAALKQSKKILKALAKTQHRLLVPKEKDIGQAKEISYNCRDYVKDKSRRIKSKFYHNININLLGSTKLYWLAMKPAHVPLGKLRDMFYSYLPSREYDMKPFRPWKDNEYMDAKEEWEKRVKKRDAEERNRI